MKNLLLFLLGVSFSCSSGEGESERKADNGVVGMRLIPAGEFDMGGKDDQAYEDEYPVHPVKVSSFYMDETEVTNQQFEVFVKTTGYITTAEQDVDWELLKAQVPPGTPKPPDSILRAGSLVFRPTDGQVSLRDYSQWWQWTIGANWRKPEGPTSNMSERKDHPAVHITYEDAKAYAAWVGKRLPTEAEWEWASMGGNMTNKYPWGNESPEKAVGKANFWQGLFPYENWEQDGFLGTSPVKSYPPNGYGLYDMAGNVWEWCQDKYDASVYEEQKRSGMSTNPTGSNRSFDPNDPYNQEKYVVRGGSFLCNDSYCSGYRVSRRMPADRLTSLGHTGFRLVRDLKD